MTERWVAVCPVEATTRRSVLPVRVDETDLVIVREKGKLRAFERACPHEQADLAHGRCVDGKLFCPRHFAWFYLQDGRASSGWGMRALRCYPVRVLGGQVLVNAAALGSPGTSLGKMCEPPDGPEPMPTTRSTLPGAGLQLFMGDPDE